MRINIYTSNKLMKEERKVLYHTFQQGFLFEVHCFSLGYLLSKYKREYDNADLERILSHLVEQGYLAHSLSSGYGIPNKRKYQEIKRLFRRERALAWLKGIMFQTWLFLWKHFILTIVVSIITAIITTYLTAKFLE